MSMTRSAIALTCVATTLVLGCKLDPKTPQLVYSLNENSLAENPDLADDASAQAQLDGALRMLFGTPTAPAFMAQEEWLDDGFDPNYWTLDEADDEWMDQLVAENREYFASQLEALEREQPLPSEVQANRFAPDLARAWQEHLDLLFDEEGPDGDMDAVIDEIDGEEITWIQEAIHMFESYYPTPATSAEMYRQQCYHCHGASGGGDGSTAPYLDPRPRDYRPGKFKFTALKDKARPRHDDLMRILTEGIYTTAMPSFARFPMSMRSGLADYVRLLAIRGETEILTAGEFDGYEGFKLGVLLDNYELTVDRWRGAGEKLIAFEGEIPHSTPERVDHGRALFMSETGANCVKCHGVQGRGNGVSAWEVGKVDEEYAKDDWKNEIQPRDLTRGIYRFGRRPIDLYRRIYAGINGTPMPEHFGMQITEPDGTTRRLDENDIWDLVFYVRALPALSGRNDRPVHQVAQEEHGMGTDSTGGMDASGSGHASEGESTHDQPAAEGH